MSTRQQDIKHARCLCDKMVSIQQQVYHAYATILSEVVEASWRLGQFRAWYGEEAPQPWICRREVGRFLEEVDVALDVGDVIAPYNKVRHLPYLKACLDKSYYQDHCLWRCGGEASLIHDRHCGWTFQIHGSSPVAILYTKFCNHWDCLTGEDFAFHQVPGEWEGEFSSIQLIN